MKSYRTEHREKTSSLCRISRIGVYAVIMAMAGAGSQITVVTDGEHSSGSTSLGWSPLVAVVLNPQATPNEKSEAIDQIDRLPQEEQIGAKKRIVAEGRSDYAYNAAVGLVMVGCTDAIDAIWEAFPRLAFREQVTILSRIRYAPIPREFLDLPRRLLEHHSRIGSRLDPTQRDALLANADVTGISAQLLKASPELRDIALVQESVRIAPTSTLAWYAVATQDEIPAEITDLALSIMKNQNLPREVRLPAATVAGKKDESGNAFVAQVLAGIVQEYAAKSLADLINRNAPDSATWAIMAKLTQDIGLLYTALLVPRESVEKIIFDAVNGRNDQLRRTTLMVALQRWPEKVLDMARDDALGNDKLAVCAAIVKFHPKLRSEVEKVVNPADLDAQLRQFEETNLWLGSHAPGLSIFGILDTSIVP